MPIVLTVDGADLCDMGRAPCASQSPRKTLRLAGREHGRAIPLADIRIAADLLDYFVGRSEQPRNGTQSLGLCDRDGNPDFTIIARGSGVQRENLISADIGRNCLLRRRLRLFRQVRIPPTARH